jgi:hypothetical protein
MMMPVLLLLLLLLVKFENWKLKIWAAAAAVPPAFCILEHVFSRVNLSIPYVWIFHSTRDYVFLLTTTTTTQSKQLLDWQFRSKTVVFPKD